MLKQLLYLILLAIFFPGCSVKYSMTGLAVPAGASTFSVEYFQNTAPLTSPQFTQRITERLKDQANAQTRLNLVKSNGDLQFSGTITHYEVVPQGIQSNETAANSRLRVRVRVNYINSLDDKMSFEQEFERFADFPSTQNFAAVESQLIDEIIRQLVQDIFNASLGNW